MTSSCSLEIADCNGNHSNMAASKYSKSSGFYISLPAACILLLLSVLLAAGVGLAVHFADGSRWEVCPCRSPETATNTTSAADIRSQCLKLAEKGDVQICTTCPRAVTTSIDTAVTKTVTTSVGTAATNAVSTTVTTVAPTSVPITTIATPPTVPSYRLPTSVYPLHYDIELQPYIYDPDPQKFTFKGRVKILVRCEHPTNNMTLHVSVLNVDPSSIKITQETPSSSGDPKYVSFTKDLSRQFFIIRLDRNVQAGQNYSIEMNFTSPLTNDLFGMYYSKYTRLSDNQTVYLAVTQLQGTYARKTFPCFDEPAMKATFNITLVRRADFTSLSNMPVDNSNIVFLENGTTFVKDVYKQTPIMSTYSLAFIVCDFDYLETRTKNNVTVRTWAKPQSVNAMQYALDIGVKVAEYFEDYFDVRYTLPKLDMFAVPDFSLGGMENWGLIMYREAYLPYKDGLTTEAAKETLAYLVAHEVAHQWFGNLVTCSSWGDTWLNEGFATYVGYMGLAKLNPDWRAFELFVPAEKWAALAADSTVVSHPVHTPVQRPSDIKAIFDDISYKKGGSLIMMMRMFLGEPTFRKGITNYLKKMSYRSATSDDLWRELTEQAKSDGKDIDVKDIMDTWILQMNYPVVTVTRDAHSAIQATQERFLSEPAANDPGYYQSPFNYTWTIPLTFTSSKDPRFELSYTDVHWLHKHEPTKTFNISIRLPDNEDTDGWILANVQRYGFYRVNYETSNWLALSRQLKRNHSVIPATNREQIISDAWSLAKISHIQVDTALATVEYLDKERDYIPWATALNELESVNKMLYDTENFGTFQKFMRDKLTDPFQHFGLVNISRDHVDALYQVVIAKHSCLYGMQSCVNEASRQYSLWMNNTSHNPIDPNFREAVYCSALINGHWTEWEFALQMYKDAKVASEKQSLLSVMSCSTQPEILNKYMETILDKDSPFPDADAINVLFKVASRNHGRHLAWNFFRDRYDALRTRFPSLMPRVSVYPFISFFKTEKELKEVQEAGQKLGLNRYDVLQAVETITSNINWMKANVPSMRKWLKDKNYLTE